MSYNKTIITVVLEWQIQRLDVYLVNNIVPRHNVIDVQCSTCLVDTIGTQCCKSSLTTVFRAGSLVHIILSCHYSTIGVLQWLPNIDLHFLCVRADPHNSLYLCTEAMCLFDTVKGWLRCDARVPRREIHFLANNSQRLYTTRYSSLLSSTVQLYVAKISVSRRNTIQYNIIQVRTYIT